jgi:hypothetical protein
MVPIRAALQEILDALGIDPVVIERELSNGREYENHYDVRENYR